MKHRCEYTYSKQFGSPRHCWTVIGAAGGIHLHISIYEGVGASRLPSGGIEFHYRHPPEYMLDDAPSQDCCSLLKCPCWHDGSSLQATERWIPLWESDPHDHDRMFELLAAELDERCGGFLATIATLREAT